MAADVETVKQAVRSALSTSGVQVSNAILVKVANAAIAAADAPAAPATGGLAEAQRRFGGRK